MYDPVEGAAGEVSPVFERHPVTSPVSQYLRVVSCRDHSPPRTAPQRALSDLSWEGESSVISERFTNTF